MSSIESILTRTPLSDLIQVTSISTTLATNAIVEGRGGTVCLLLIGYPHDALDRAKLRDAIRNDPIEFISGGHTASGDESRTLDLDAAKSAILRHAPSVTAFTVAGMFSVRNTEHEVAVRNLVLELTDKPVTCTVRIDRQPQCTATGNDCSPERTPDRTNLPPD